MNESAELYSIGDVARVLSCKYQTAQKKILKLEKIKGSPLNQGKKTENGRIVNAYFLTPTEIEAITQDYTYNKQKIYGNTPNNMRSFNDEPISKNHDIIEINTENSVENQLKILMESIKKGYEIALESKDQLITEILKDKEVLTANNKRLIEHNLELKEQINLIMTVQNTAIQHKSSPENKWLRNIKNAFSKFKPM